MRTKTVNCLRKVQKLTQAKCETCPESLEHRCCDVMFCRMAEKTAQSLGYNPVETGHKIPFMGKSGCVIPAEFRPGCSGFVCGHHFKDRTFRRKYNRLDDEIRTDPDVIKSFNSLGPMFENIKGES